MDWQIYLNGLTAMLIFGVVGWLISLYRNNVTHVDSMWSLFFVVAAGAYACSLQISHISEISIRGCIMLSLLTLWALRLCIYLTWRNWGPHEDHRYATIRANNEPHFRFKSLYIIFGLRQYWLGLCLCLYWAHSTQTTPSTFWMPSVRC